MGRPAVLIESMWSRLPKEILESKILPFLPIVSLCRFRTVSKEWNKLISHPDFASTHARASSPEEHVLITVRTDLPFDTTGGWEVLDVANNKVYTIRNDFLTKYVQQECGAKHQWIQRKILAADGGLFFVLYAEDDKVPDSVPMFLVCSPILRTAKLLPALAGWTRSYDRRYESVAMTTDRTSMEYKIVVFHVDDDHYQTNSMDIFESKVGRWRTAVNSILSGSPHRDSGIAWHCGSVLVKLKGFYKLYRVDGQMDLRLVSYDQMTGVASELGFGLPVDDDAYVQSVALVVSKERLFCVVRRGASMFDVSSLKIFEVIVASKECIECAEIPSNLLKWVLGDDPYVNGEWDTEDVKYSYEEPIVATGCASSILFCSCIGRSVAYNLLDKSWYQYLDNKILQAHGHFSWCYRNLYCCNYCLSLCAP